jgi:EAL domain-containing protein (putative c-di-GMP-specific phosphodiesterase class I)
MAAGCQVMQGYLFAHPGLPETIEGLLCTDLCNSKSNEGDLARLYTALEGSSVPEESPVSVRR